MDTAVVELDALADPVGAGPEDQHSRLLSRPYLVGVLVGGVVVGGGRLELGRAGVDRLEGGQHAGALPGCPHVRWGGVPQVGELGVGEAKSLGPAPSGPAHRGRLCRLERTPLGADAVDLVEEPPIHAGGRVHGLDRLAPPQQRLQLEDPLRRGNSGGRHQLGVTEPVTGRLGRVGIESQTALLERAQALLQRLAERAADGHHLAHGLHRRSQGGRGRLELLERPPGDLGDDVVEGGLEGGRSDLGYVVGDLVERAAHCQASRDLGDGEPCGLGGQRRGAAHPGVHLDDHLATGGRIDRELHVGSAGLHPHPAQHRERCVAHPLVLRVAESLCGGHGDGVTGVHPHRVQVLDGADHHTVVGPVAHHLELELLPAHDRLLDQDLGDGAGVQPGFGHPLELLGGGGDARAAAAEDVGGPHDHRQAHVPENLAGPRHVLRYSRAGDVQADLEHGLLEEMAVLGGGDRGRVGPDQLGAVGLQDASGDQFHGQVQPGLASQGGQKGVGPLPLDDAGQHVGVERLDVGGVGHLRVGHDRGRVGVGQDHPVSLGPQHPAGLGSGVVELAGLADDDGARPDYEDRLDVVTARHDSGPSARHAATQQRSVVSSGRGTAAVHQLGEGGEVVAGVVGSRAGLGVVLNAEGSLAVDRQTLEGAVVEAQMGLGHVRHRP